MLIYISVNKIDGGRKKVHWINGMVEKIHILPLLGFHSRASWVYHCGEWVGGKELWLGCGGGKDVLGGGGGSGMCV